ncbi:MAG: hypothetical protein MJA27_19245 [Pseudanabaenales cyanobacterium]|nr:hypothetical protein [Pseudanabaenales cyanobacterium]
MGSFSFPTCVRVATIELHRKTPLAPMSQYVRSTVLTAMQKVGGRTQGQGGSVQRRPDLELE